MLIIENYHCKSLQLLQLSHFISDLKTFGGIANFENTFILIVLIRILILVILRNYFFPIESEFHSEIS